jgi:signal transduction histidine kinase/ActR/RegA family two-component response regulator
MLVAAVFALGMASPQDPRQPLVVGVLCGLFLLTNVLVSILPRRVQRSTPLEFTLGLVDTAAVSYVLYHADPSGILCLFFFPLLATTAMATRIGQILLSSCFFSGLYLAMGAIRQTGPELLSPSNLLVLPFFYAASVHFGYQVVQIRERQARTDRVFRERQELALVAQILESITSSLEFHTVMYEITTRIADLVDAGRCSVVLVQEGVKDRGFVVATSDNRSMDKHPIDLTRYPEIQEALRTREAVLVDDIAASPMMQSVVDQLHRMDLQSLLVLPLLYREHVLGTLFLRASRKRAFAAEELRLCRTVASAAASAINNSMLHRALTERSEQQERLVARMQSVFDSSPDLILHIEREGRIRQANRRVEQLTKTSLVEVHGSEIDRFVRGLPPPAELLTRVRSLPSPFTCDATLVAADGRSADLSVTIGAVGEPDGGLILIARDVSEQKKEAAAAQQREKLSRIGEVMAGVAHELNNPLSGVLGFAQLLQQKDQSGEHRREVDRILECADRCQKIVRSLLMFARPTGSDRRPLGLNGVLEKTVDLLSRDLRADGIEVVKELEPGLPFILADFHQLQQVLTNLITNAQQAMKVANGRGRLVLRTFSREGHAAVSIGDDGPGIPPEILPRIFDPFFSTKKVGKGTGLGLSISYGIVLDHGGEILVDSEVGKGAVFTAVFPQAAAQVEDAQPRSASVGGPARGSRILAVDDEPILLDLYMEILRAMGHSVDTASGGAEALRKLERERYDIVITDIKMPQISGVELYRRAQGLRPEMRHQFIFITGDVNFLSDDQHSTITDCPCLLKPVDVSDIENAIHDLLAAQPPPAAADALH